MPIETASAPSARALATSAPVLIPPETISCTSRSTPSSRSASPASLTAARVGMPACSMNVSWVAPVPPCMPSTTTTSAPAATASFTSWLTRVAPTLT